MIDICFVGNSSLDKIITKKENKDVYGGSAIYSALSCRSSTNKKISVISNVNNKLKQVLSKYNIDLIGNINDEITTFSINEIENKCEFIKNISKPIIINNPVKINYLHISFRKGVDIDSILNNKNIIYNNLSVDVMIHSVLEFIPYIEKYIDKINTIFCNMDEYQIIKKYISSIPNVIITNQDKPVVVIENNKNYIYKFSKNNIPISTTGAGDSFIGGYLAKFCETKDIGKSVISGIINASASINNFGPLLKKQKNNQNIESYEIPKNIIVIGNSCAGKTTFIDFFKSYFDIYTDIDDLDPLLEMFLIDDISTKNDINKLRRLKDKLVYMKDICDEYLDNFSNINHYSKIAKNGKGHDIINPVLWDLILKKSVSYNKKSNNIIQFSRGRDLLYEKKFGKDVYKRSIETVLNELDYKENLIIINLVSDLNIRKRRNIIRYKNGGHFVSEETMDNVYKDDVFIYNKFDENRGEITLNSISYPVYTILNNKILSEFELNNFLLYNTFEIIKYFQVFREDDLNEYERNSKRNMAKQSK